MSSQEEKSMLEDAVLAHLCFPPGGSYTIPSKIDSSILLSPLASIFENNENGKKSVQGSWITFRKQHCCVAILGHKLLRKTSCPPHYTRWLCRLWNGSSRAGAAGMACEFTPVKHERQMCVWALWHCLPCNGRFQLLLNEMHVRWPFSFPSCCSSSLWLVYGLECLFSQKFFFTSHHPSRHACTLHVPTCPERHAHKFDDCRISFLLSNDGIAKKNKENKQSMLSKIWKLYVATQLIHDTIILAAYILSAPCFSLSNNCATHPDIQDAKFSPSMLLSSTNVSPK